MPPLQTVLRQILDFLLPHAGLRKAVETMSANTFLERAEKSEEYLGEMSFAALRYRDPLVRAAIWALKYHQSQHATELLAEALYSELVEYIGDRAAFEHGKTYLLVPVPLSKTRRRERGFNQAELLAQTLLRTHPDLPFTYIPDILERKRDIKHQTDIKRRSERITNMVNCLSVPDQKRVRGQYVVVLDDVTTTGATLNEARRALTDAGAREVIALAVAH